MHLYSDLYLNVKWQGHQLFAVFRLLDEFLSQDQYICSPGLGRKCWHSQKQFSAHYRVR